MTTGTRSGRQGFSLVEILVTIVLIAVALMCLMPVAMRVARQGALATVSAQRTAALAGEVQRVEQLAFTSLSTGTSCTDYPTADFAHTTCITVSSLDATDKQVSVVVTPYQGGVPDTTTVTVSSSTRYNPLKP